MTKEQTPDTGKTETVNNVRSEGSVSEPAQVDAIVEENEVISTCAGGTVESTQLEDRLTAMEQKLEEYRDAMTRAQADLINVQNQADRDIRKARKYSVGKLIMDLLPGLDSLVRGLEGMSADDAKLANVREGMSLTLEIFNKSIIKHGVEIISPEVGDAFNPEAHEAMSMTKNPEAKSNTILQVLQKGYRLHGRVLRAAMVIVAA